MEMVRRAMPGTCGEIIGPPERLGEVLLCQAGAGDGAVLSAAQRWPPRGCTPYRGRFFLLTRSAGSAIVVSP